MNKKCAKCSKTVYTTEELKCLDKLVVALILTHPRPASSTSNSNWKRSKLLILEKHEPELIYIMNRPVLSQITHTLTRGTESRARLKVLEDAQHLSVVQIVQIVTR
ncbi:hypothetical protein RRG08_006392 [Elysia crispata]|uniref:Uncharacterized protein n=1 Tax=Elysia crispata TaxID=231223 RepID=A0AAE1CRX5_9GAST|nr:hypothetical protein RRG08_006392 [Elysia crispata]